MVSVNFADEYVHVMKETISVQRFGNETVELEIDTDINTTKTYVTGYVFNCFFCFQK